MKSKWILLALSVMLVVPAAMAQDRGHDRNRSDQGRDRSSSRSSDRRDSRPARDVRSSDRNRDWSSNPGEDRNFRSGDRNRDFNRGVDRSYRVEDRNRGWVSYSGYDRDYRPRIVDAHHYRLWIDNQWQLFSFDIDDCPTWNVSLQCYSAPIVIDNTHFRVYRYGHWVTREFRGGRGFRH